MLSKWIQKKIDLSIQKAIDRYNENLQNGNLFKWLLKQNADLKNRIQELERKNHA